jgi:hypothetical protein
MVYGFDTDSTFGNFLPDAEMPGYWEYLEQQFKEMSAKGVATHEFFTQFEEDFSRECLYGTHPIDEVLMPKNFVLAKPYQALGDFITLGMGYAVTARFRDLIEKLEPGRHQFIPIKITLRSGKDYPVEYFTFRVLSQLDAFDKNKSDPTCWKKSVQILKIAQPKEENARGIALSRNVIADHHIWRGFVSAETGISGFKFYVSDKLKTAIAEAKFKMMPFYQLKEV